MYTARNTKVAEFSIRVTQFPAWDNQSPIDLIWQGYRLLLEVSKVYNVAYMVLFYS